MRHQLRLALAALCLAVLALPARAQVTSTTSGAVSPSGWSFGVAPYVWLPTISSSVTADGPLGGTVIGNVSAGIGDYLSDINFATMLGAEARYDRFSVMTDLIYLNTSLTTNTSHLSTVNLGPGPIYIPRSQQLGVRCSERPVGRSLRPDNSEASTLCCCITSPFVVRILPPSAAEFPVPLSATLGLLLLRYWKVPRRAPVQRSRASETLVGLPDDGDDEKQSTGSA